MDWEERYVESWIRVFEENYGRTPTDEEIETALRELKASIDHAADERLHEPEYSERNNH